MTEAVVAGPGPATTAGHQEEDFADLYRRTRPSLIAYLHRIGCGADAEDIVQDAFETFYRAALMGKTPEYAQAWLRVVARRNAIQRARRNLSSPESPEDLERLQERLQEASDNTVDAAEKELERAEIIRRIQDLPERHQEVLALFLDGYQPHEMAPQLGIARSLARRRLGQAQAALWKITLDSRSPAKRKASAGHRSISVAPVCDAWPTEKEIERATNLLPPRQRQILQWSRRGYKPGQVAKLLGISANTARANLCHARKKLHYHLEQRSAQEETAHLRRYGSFSPGSSATGRRIRGLRLDRLPRAAFGRLAYQSSMVRVTR